MPLNSVSTSILARSLIRDGRLTAPRLPGHTKTAKELPNEESSDVSSHVGKQTVGASDPRGL